MFNTDVKLQEYINIISNEGHIEDLVDACDNLHFRFESTNEALEWGINFGEFLGKYRFGESVWKFTIPCEDLIIYFIGTRKEVEMMLLKFA